MKPDLHKAVAVLQAANDNWRKMDQLDLFCAISKALAYLKGYELPPEIIAKYRCTFCGAGGVKLWRGVGTDDGAWCSRCGTEQAGLPDNADADGKFPSEFGGKSDQIYSPHKGQNLLPWVPAPDGGTWGYTSVPEAGCIWWRSLPTRAALAAAQQEQAR